METITLPKVPQGTVWAFHGPDWCSGRSCPVHAPSNHHMRDWPLLAPSNPHAVVLERVCPRHGVAHPDPDSVEQATTFDPTHEGEHGLHPCCGCCTP